MHKVSAVRQSLLLLLQIFHIATAVTFVREANVQLLSLLKQVN